MTDFDNSGSIGDIVDEMKQKGYQGPFMNLCNGVACITFHGPDVSMHPAWIGSDDNVFQMRIVDCERFSADSFLYAMGAEATQSVSVNFDPANIGAVQFRVSLDNPHVEPCLLGFPKQVGEIPEGLQFAARCMEDHWHIFLLEGYLYFVRSWTGQVRHRAKLDIRDHAFFVTEVATNSTPLGDCVLRADPLDEDHRFGVRQVDFLIKSLLCALPSPAPLPSNAPTEAGGIALYALTEYGRIGQYPTFDETTEFRRCLNGMPGRFPANPDNTILLNAIQAATVNADRDAHRCLLDELRDRRLMFAFGVPDEELEQGAISNDTPVQFAIQQWEGHPCLFAYTDTTYRVEASHGCIAVVGKGLSSFASQLNNDVCIVINPAGPATCVINRAELRALASES